MAGTVLVEQASFYFSDELLDRFDIVGWDPRGRAVRPLVDCVDDLDLVPDLHRPDAPDSPEELQQLAAVDAVLVAGCSARSGSLLPYVSTQATARDMDSLRRALGEDRVSYFGFSYGSELRDVGDALPEDRPRRGPRRRRQPQRGWRPTRRPRLPGSSAAS